MNAFLTLFESSDNFAAEILGGLPDPIPAWRAVADRGFGIDLEYPGTSWSFDRDAAITFGKHNGATHLLYAEIPHSLIDWAASEELFDEFSSIFDADSEFEIRVRDDAEREVGKLARIEARLQ